MLLDPVTNQIVGVNLSAPLGVSDPPSHTFTFNRPVMDPVAQAIASVWYSWAKYYQDATSGVVPPPKPVDGNIGAGSNILVLTSATPGLVPGMAVTDAQGTSHGVITGVGIDNKTITLSQAQAGALFDGFNFAKPSVASIVGYDPSGLTPIKTFTFNGTDEQNYARAFAQNVYVVMATMGRTVKSRTTNTAIPLLGNIIGGNVGPAFLPDQNQAIQTAITDQIKSALRGVPDFTNPAYANPSQWYPDPALKTGGQNFNVYNLDPFIWFIHQKLGLSAYAFGLDDDIGDVGAGGSTKLDVSVGGLGGLPKQDPNSPVPYPFANTANYGPVQGAVAQAPPIGSSVITGLPLAVVNQIAGANFSNNTAGVLVNGPGIPIGTTVVVYDSKNGTVTLSAPVTSFTPGSTTYSFYGPVVGTGKVLGSGQPTNTVQGLSLDAYYTLLKMGDLTNVQVTGPGIDPKSPVTVDKLFLENGVPVVVLSKAFDPSKISEIGGSFAYTFGYAALSPIVNGGFEQPPGVADVTDGFLHGAQLAPAAGAQQWVFTDASNSFFAGIAGNGSIYTKQNGPAPQGLQVAFIQGKSRISQQITLAQGTYTLSLMAAQRATNQSPQTLNVIVDTTQVGTVDPTGPKYAQSLITFTVGAGAHTIIFQGTSTAGGTVLIDAVGFKTPSALTGVQQDKQPASVEFLEGPDSGSARSNLGPVLVEAFNRSGDLLKGENVRLTLIRVGRKSRGHLVRGSVVHAKALGGVATFRRLIISAPGRYILRAWVGRRHVDSAVFEIGPALPKA
jgi:hypothetical protein